MGSRLRGLRNLSLNSVELKQYNTSDQRRKWVNWMQGATVLRVLSVPAETAHQSLPMRSTVQPVYYDESWIVIDGISVRQQSGYDEAS